ncbi:hypothetical protein GEMRC1_003748 [Eukaryota sp. GEM-RC1]
MQDIQRASARAAQISARKSTTPAWERLPVTSVEVDRDPNRLIQSTVAFKHRVEEARDRKDAESGYILYSSKKCVPNWRKDL